MVNINIQKMTLVILQLSRRQLWNNILHVVSEQTLWHKTKQNTTLYFMNYNTIISWTKKDFIITKSKLMEM